MIAVFDSGVGGLSVWREIVRRFPCENTLYLADQAHVPYGSRSLGEVRRFSAAIADFLLEQGAEVIVVACNTASAAALHHLRRLYPEIPFVGMEPAVKPAVESTRRGIVGVIATEATFQGELFTSLLERYAADVEVFTQICPGLVEAVEVGALDTAGTEALLRRCLAPLIEARVDQLVLGCTHYPFLRPQIERIIEGGISVIDPGPAVARQTGRVLARGGDRPAPEGRGRREFYTTGDPELLTKMIRQLVPQFCDAAQVQKAHWAGESLRVGGDVQ